MRNHILMPAWVILLSTAGIARAEVPQRHVVVIGINDYADPAILDLQYAESDAKAVIDTLTDPAIGRFPKGNVKLLLGAQASPSAIKSALYGLRGVSKDDLVIIFYSGHGAKEGDEAYWVTPLGKIRWRILTRALALATVAGALVLFVVVFRRRSATRS